MNAYCVSTEVFNGPLDLLLSLIEKRKLLINDIALSEVTDDYLKHLEQHPEFPIAETAQFVLVGSTLLLIKSKSLLPVLSLTGEEQDSIANLELRLKILDRYKTIARSILERFDSCVLRGRMFVKRRHVEFIPDNTLTQTSIAYAMYAVLQNLPKCEPKLSETTVKKVVSLEEMMVRLTDRINTSMQVSFRQFSSSVPEGKINVIVSFLAMLELVRQGVIRVEQHEKFSDIKMHVDAVQLPRYG